MHKLPSYKGQSTQGYGMYCMGPLVSFLMFYANKRQLGSRDYIRSLCTCILLHKKLNPLEIYFHAVMRVLNELNIMFLK